MEKVFINASLSAPEKQRLNKAIKELLENLGYKCYLPQEALPPSEQFSPGRILSENVAEVAKCDIMVSVFDDAEPGVAFELGLGLALNKIIVVLWTDERPGLGKIMEEFWLALDPTLKARSLDELKEIFETRPFSGKLSISDVINLRKKIGLRE